MAYNETLRKDYIMLLAIFSFLAGVVLTAIVACVVIWKNNQAAKLDSLDAEEYGWSTGFNAGWHSASTDYFHVKECYRKLNSPQED